MGRIIRQGLAIAGHQVSDFEDVGHRAHLVCRLVLSHANYVLVEVFCCLQILCDALLELIEGAA